MKKEVSFVHFVYWGFLTLLTVISGFVLKSIVALNINVAVVIERVAQHETRLSAVETRLLEKK